MADELRKENTPNDGTNPDDLAGAGNEETTSDLELSNVTVDFGDENDSDGNADNFFKELGLDQTSDETSDNGDQNTAKSEREKELEDRLTEQGRTIKKLEDTLANLTAGAGAGNANNTEIPMPAPTGDPHQDNANLLAHNQLRLEAEWKQERKFNENVEAYMDDGIDRKTAKELATLMESNSVEDRLKWGRLLNEAKGEVSRRDSRRLQQLEDRSGVRGGHSGRSGSAKSSTNVSPTAVANKLREKYDDPGERIDELFKHQDALGEDFILEVAGILSE